MSEFSFVASESADSESEDGDFITMHKAVKIYGLKYSDFYRLPAERIRTKEIKTRWLHMNSSLPLFRKETITNYLERRQQQEQERNQRQLNRVEAKKREYQTRAHTAEEQLRRYKNSRNKKASSVEKHGKVQLPHEVLLKIMRWLAAFDAAGVRGPSMAANDLANAALVCWDLYNAAKHGFRALERRLQHIQLQPTRASTHAAEAGVTNAQLAALAALPDPQGYSLQEWEKIIADPLACTNQKLSAAARQLALPRNGNKAMLAVRILGAFGLKEPNSSVDAHALRVVALERYRVAPWQQCKHIQAASANLMRIGEAAAEGLRPGLGAIACCAASSGPGTHQVLSASQLRKLLWTAGVRSRRQLKELKELISHEMQRQELEHLRKLKQQQQQQQQLVVGGQEVAAD